MKKYLVKISKTADKDIDHYRISGDIVSFKRVQKILDELEKHPYTGIGKSEMLKFQLAGKWSRRINKKDRLIYTVKESEVEVRFFPLWVIIYNNESKANQRFCLIKY